MSGLDVAHVRIVINAGLANEVTITPGSLDVALLEADVRLSTGSHAQKLTLKAIDRVGAWRKASFGSTIVVYLQGEAVFTGTITIPRVDVVGSGVLLELDAVGRTYILYTKQIIADATYTSQTTGYIVNDLVDSHFTGVLTSTNVVTATGVTLDEFVVSIGENVGAVFERLATLDGYSFFVDVDDDVHYFDPPTAASQETFYEDDLVGEPGEHFVETGVTPPRNFVRVKGGSGYSDTIRQAERDSYYTLDSTAEYVAQRFVASSNRLSAVAVWADWTTGANEPGAMAFGVYKDAYNLAPDATLTTAVGGSATIASATNVNDENDTTSSFYQFSGAVGEYVDYKFDMGVAATVRGWRTLVANFTNPPIVIELFWSDDGSSYTSADSYSVATGASTSTQRWFADLSHRYWKVRITHTPNGGIQDGDLYEVELLGTGTGSRRRRPAYDSAGTHLVQWSDDVTFATTSLRSPPAFTSNQSYDASNPIEAQRTLQLTSGATYWAVFKASSDASGSKYWRVGYYAASSAYANGEAKVTTDSGTTWSALNYDLTFKLFFSATQIDVTDTDAASIALYGEWYYEEVLPDITSTADAEYVASQILANGAAPGVRMTLPLKRVWPSLTPTERVTVVRPLLDINNTYNVAEIRHEIRRGGARTVIVTGTTPYNGARALEELRKRD